MIFCMLGKMSFKYEINVVMEAWTVDVMCFRQSDMTQVLRHFNSPLSLIHVINCERVEGCLAVVQVETLY